MVNRQSPIVKTAPRRAGILLHPTSFPGRYGIGTLNRAAFDWIDFLQRTHQSLWQVLPLGPTGYGDSPYQSFSTFAGNPYLISLEDLVGDGLLDRALLEQAPALSAERVDYGALYRWKLPLLRHLADQFRVRSSPTQRESFEQFCHENAPWLDDYALFMALKEAHNGTPWHQWEMPLRSRQAQTIATAQSAQSEAIHAHKLNQWHFYRQWQQLKEYANAKGIQIIGDIPIYVAMDSADVWANPTEFLLDDDYQPIVVAGVPPDYFSETGQLWGNPLYRWESMGKRGFDWWIARIRAALRLYDSVRIDHFRGFAGYWAVPAGEETAINGEWRVGPGAALFEAIDRELESEWGVLPIIAEDLGEITPDVVALRDRFKLPGMKILQFAFGSDATDKFLPHNYSANFVVYPGTHDNDTTLGWYQNSSSEQERDYLRRYCVTDGSDVAWTLIRLAHASVASTAIVALQDVLSLGSDARMNFPGRAEGNWGWRFRSEQLNEQIEARLRDVTMLYGRDPMLEFTP